MPLDISSLVLVAVMNNPRDLEIARVLGWYRIPLRSAPKVIAVDYLAFYQTSSFKSEKWRIQYIAEVQGHELTSRAELLRDEWDHPRAKDEYFKIQIGPLERLPHPVPADIWRRITFFYTTGEYLLEAKTIRDLIVRTEERSTLWKALREKAKQSDQYSTADMPEFALDQDTLALLLGISQSD